MLELHAQLSPDLVEYVGEDLGDFLVERLKHQRPSLSDDAVMEHFGLERNKDSKVVKAAEVVSPAAASAGSDASLGGVGGGDAGGQSSPASGGESADESNKED